MKRRRPFVRSLTLPAYFGSIVLLFGASCADSGGPVVTESPPPSAGHALVYHDSLGLVLLLNAGLGTSDDALQAGEPTRVWGWQNRRWRLLDSSGPPVRNLAGVAYDSRRNRVVMHGGSSPRGVTLSETWEWGDAGWTLQTSSGPGLRDHTAMAYDPVRGRTVLFSGQVRIDSFPQDTWEWDGSSWTRVATSGPPPRVHHSMAFDSASGRVLLFGGYQPGVSDLGDTWAWDGNQWTFLGTAPAQTHSVLAFHGGLETVVVIGGMRGQAAAPLMSVWSNGQWVVSGGATPPARYLPGAAFDASRGRLVLFGGGNAAGMDLLSDTWEHDGTSWSRAGEP
jgi:hypothetical protein